MMKLLILFLLVPASLFSQMGPHRKIFASGSPCALPFTDSFTGSGALGTPCWTQTTAPGFVNMVMSSGTVTSASAGNSLALETGSGVATTQSIQAAFNFSGSGHSNLVVHGDVARQNSYQWSILDGMVYSEVGGTFNLLGSTTGTIGSPTSGDVLVFSVSGTTLTCTNLTHAGTNTFSTASFPIASGYAGLLIDTGSNSQSFGPATVN